MFFPANLNLENTLARKNSITKEALFNVKDRWKENHITEGFFRQLTTPCKPPIGITKAKVTKFCVALL